MSGPPGIHYQSGWPIVYLNVSYLSGPPGIHHISGWPIVHLNVSYLSDPPIRSVHCALKYCLFERPTFQVGPLFIKMLLILAAHQAWPKCPFDQFIADLYPNLESFCNDKLKKKLCENRALPYFTVCFYILLGFYIFSDVGMLIKYCLVVYAFEIFISSLMSFFNNITCIRLIHRYNRLAN